ncbi:hypothetical protein LCGC14_0295240 [marine sediment metagenome]|uniref:2'-deoxynucleoside 5'-phosphate N-hydrolase 1 n=1 Tax=marine sediment metagenome TaxID=412755 RepID=A0A0F9WDG1_9ZZZZ
MKKVYLIGSLRNPQLPVIGNHIRDLGFDVFDDWWAGGYEADDWWQKYEQTKGRSYAEALGDRYAKHIFEFDLHHLNTSDLGVLVLPAGKSGHIEMGYLIGRGIPCYVLFEGEPERFDVMYRFASKVFLHLDDLLTELKGVFHAE